MAWRWRDTGCPTKADEGSQEAAARQCDLPGSARDRSDIPTWFRVREADGWFSSGESNSAATGGKPSGLFQVAY